MVRLLEQLEYALRLGVGLREHSLCSLQQDVVLGVLHHFFRHVDVADAGLCGLQVLPRRRHVVRRMLKLVLQRAVFCASGVDLGNRRFNNIGSNTRRVCVCFECGCNSTTETIRANRSSFNRYRLLAIFAIGYRYRTTTSR